jgi:hypothetical protein
MTVIRQAAARADVLAFGSPYRRGKPHSGPQIARDLVLAGSLDTFADFCDYPLMLMNPDTTVLKDVESPQRNLLQDPPVPLPPRD